MWLGRVGEKILTTTRIRPREGHAHRPSIVPMPIQLIANGVPRPAAAVTTWIAILRDEIRYDAMKREAVIIPSLGKRDEVRHGQWCVRGGQIHLNRAANCHDGYEKWPVAKRSTKHCLHLFQIPS